MWTSNNWLWIGARQISAHVVDNASLDNVSNVANVFRVDNVAKVVNVTRCYSFSLMFFFTHCDGKDPSNDTRAHWCITLAWRLHSRFDSCSGYILIGRSPLGDNMAGRHLALTWQVTAAYKTVHYLHSTRWLWKKLRRRVVVVIIIVMIMSSLALA